MRDEIGTNARLTDAQKEEARALLTQHKVLRAQAEGVKARLQQIVSSPRASQTESEPDEQSGEETGEEEAAQVRQAVDVSLREQAAARKAGGRTLASGFPKKPAPKGSAARVLLEQQARAQRREEVRQAGELRLKERLGVINDKRRQQGWAPLREAEVQEFSAWVRSAYDSDDLGEAASRVGLQTTEVGQWKYLWHCDYPKGAGAKDTDKLPKLPVAGARAAPQTPPVQHAAAGIVSDSDVEEHAA